MDAEGHLTTDLYIKPTDTHQYLHKDSCHPGHCKKGIPHSQVLRIHHIFSRNEDFLQRTRELTRFLITWGYNEDEVQQQINKTMGLDRDELLLTKKIKTPLEQVPLIVTYHPSLPPLKNILDKHSSILTVSERLNQAVRTPPLVAYHRSPSLKIVLVCATFNLAQGRI